MNVLDNTTPCGRKGATKDTNRTQRRQRRLQAGWSAQGGGCPLQLTKYCVNEPWSTRNPPQYAQRREHSSSKKRRVANRTRSIKKVSFRTHPHHPAPAQRPSRGANRTQRGVVSTRWRIPFATYGALCQLTVVDTESPTVRTASRAQQQQEEGGGKPHAQHQEG